MNILLNRILSHLLNSIEGEVDRRLSRKKRVDDIFGKYDLNRLGRCTESQFPFNILAKVTNRISSHNIEVKVCRESRRGTTKQSTGLS